LLAPASSAGTGTFTTRYDRGAAAATTTPVTSRSSPGSRRVESPASPLPRDDCRQRWPRLLRARRGGPESGQRKSDRNATRCRTHGVLTFTVIAIVVPYDGAVGRSSRGSCAA
jgi:hypothetical protein